MDSPVFTVMSLCAGIGGLDLGLRLAVPSARTVCMVEREAFAVATLVAKMEEGHLDPCPIWTDLARFDGKAWRGTVDCIVGGYPCQPFSVAGARKGEEDPRHLWPHVARIVGEVQPTVVFFENVSGHLSLGFEQVAEELQAMGYVVKAGLFAAAEVGASHRRQRLFIYGKRAMADADSARLEEWRRQRGNAYEEFASVIGDRHVFPPGPTDFEAWERVEPKTQPAVRRVVDGPSSWVDRLRALGNGVVPLVAAVAFRTLAEDSSAT